MRTLILFTLLLPLQALAEAPECPIYPNKRMCLTSVDESLKKFLDFIDTEYSEDPEDKKKEMIQAANDIKHYESLACQKTCLN